MDELDPWRLSKHLSIVQAALLHCGFDPSKYQDSVEVTEADKRPEGYDAVKSAISNALKYDVIDGELIHYTNTSYDQMEILVHIDPSVDLTESTVEVESLRSWLKDQGVTTGFFFQSSTATGTPEYLDPDHSRYAPKLAAAVKAWLACGDESSTQSKPPKQALIMWLRKNAAEFDLCHDDGTPNESGIEETAKVANWKRGGGAPKTHGS